MGRSDLQYQEDVGTSISVPPRFYPNLLQLLLFCADIPYI